MKSRKGTLIAAFAAFIAASCIAADEKDQPLKLETRTYTVPPDFLSGLGSLVPAPIDPFSTSADKAAAKRRTVTVRTLLEQQGVIFPKGAVALFDPARSVLTVRNTKPNLDLINLFADPLGFDKTISFTVQVIEAPNALLRGIPEITEPRDATHHLSQLLSQAALPGSSVRILHTAFLETPSGQHATLESAASHEYTEKWVPDANGRMEAHGIARPLGFRMEIDPAITADGLTIDTNVSIQLTSLQDQPSSPPPFKTGQVQTQMTIPSGGTVLAGMWPVAEGRGRAVFLTAHVITQLYVPSPDPSLTGIPKDAAAMMEHTFDLPPQLLRRSADTSRGEWSELLPLKGIELPQGSHVRVDKPDRLIVRTTAEMMAAVDTSVQHLLNTLPKSLTFRLEVFRAPAAMVRTLIDESASLSDHSSALQKLKAAVTAGAASQEILNILETKGGRAKINAHLDHHIITELSWLKNFPPGIATLHCPSGLDFEIDSLIEADGCSIPFSFALERHFTPPKPWQEPLAAAGSDRGLIMPRGEFPRVHVQASNRILNGHSKIIAAWRPVGERGNLESDVLEVAFLSCRIERQATKTPLPSLPANLPPPKAIPKSVGPGPMYTRSYRVTPSFGWDFDDVRPDQDWVRELLIHKGVSFPEGADTMKFGNVAMQIVITNTPANLEKIEALVQEYAKREVKSLRFVLHLFEAPSPEVQSVLAAQGSALEEMLARVRSGAARSLLTLSVPTKPESLATVEQVEERIYFEGTKFNDQGIPHNETNMTPVGTTFSVDPKVSRDGLTIDLTCSLSHHPTPPVPHTENLAPAGSPPIEIPLTDFHIESYEGALTMLSGTARILAIWKPTGRPEFAEKDLLHIAILEARAEPVED